MLTPGLAISDPGRKSAIPAIWREYLEGAIRPEPDDGENQNGNWLDVTVGADMLLNQILLPMLRYLRQKIPLTIATIVYDGG